MIEIRDLSKSFGDVHAVNELTVTFNSGIVGLVGINGAGKSTLLRLIAGIYRPDTGFVTINGIPADEFDAKKDVFFLCDDPYAPRGATVKGIFEFYDSLFDIDKDKFNALIDSFELPRNRNVLSFSKGMRRQVFIALSLAMKVNHLLLDEAFDGLDPLVVETIKHEVVNSAREGKTIIISSHNIFALQHIVDRFAILHAGRITKQEDSQHMGNTFLKFQAAFKTDVTEAQIQSLGYVVLSLNKVGSVTHFVISAPGGALEVLKSKFEPLFIEEVPLSAEEIVAFEMKLAKKEGK